MTKRTTLLLAVALALVLAACQQPIVVTDEGYTSSASRVVEPATATVRGVPTRAIAIRMRNCQLVQLRVQDVEHDITLAPRAHVTDATGKVFFSSTSFLDQEEVRPAGSSEDPDVNDGAHQIIVPVAGAVSPLTISTWCDNYTPGSHGMYPRWDFPDCTTSRRRCAATHPGDGDWNI